MKKRDYKTGKKYKIKDFFSGENDKINIPDLQRDYCWGENENLIKDFINNVLLLSSQKPGSHINQQKPAMGLIYGYFQEHFDSFMQLCDGQQRLTTIFLILGIIQRMLGGNFEENLLMSSFEHKDDDHEPYLRYSIRESSLYFLSDLTYYYFLNPESEEGENKTPSDFIVNQPWFLHEYFYDSTIKNILNTIDIVTDVLLANNFTKEELRKIYEEIGNIEFLYYDMGSRVNGEKTFVIINTTGEPLTSTQNLKPLIINKGADLISEVDTEIQKRKEISQKWEEMETWFWKNRNKNIEETGDNGMSAFLHTIWFYKSPDQKTAYERYEWDNGIHSKQIMEVHFDEIYRIFTSYRRLVKLFVDFRDGNNPSQLTASNLYVIMPLLKYLEKFPDASDFELRREFEIFNNMARYRSINRDSRYNTAPAYLAMKIVEAQSNKDTFSLINRGLEGNEDYMVEERHKLQFIKNNVVALSDKDGHYDLNSERNKIEQSIWKIQSSPIYGGKIKNLLQWSSDDYDKFVELAYKIEEFLVEPKNNEKKRDLFRRYFLMFYKPQDHFWYGWKELNDLISIPGVLDRLYEMSGESYENIVNEALNKYNDLSDPFYLVIKDPEILFNTNSKKFKKFENGIIDIMRSNSNNTSHLYIYKCDTLNADLGLNKVGKIRVGNFAWSDLSDYNLWIEMNPVERRIMYHTDSYPDRPDVPENILVKINEYLSKNSVSEETPLTDLKNLCVFIDELLTEVENKKLS
ncbi:MAG: DUF262 domain-containing protein [Muribaculaceae bacterium]|nr:DUF262 domain-containing protein [Muribaculaceae bacterium]